MKNSQIKSRERISRYEEVYTAEREVNAMLNLVGHESEKIDSTFLEPACGNGNFLIEILRRKLKTVQQAYGNSKKLFSRYALLAISSIYGVDIQKDNVEECRERLKSYFVDIYVGLFGVKPLNNLVSAVSQILNDNICWGNTLTYANGMGEPLRMFEWQMLPDGNFIKKAFLLETMDTDESAGIVYNWQ